MSSVKNPFIDEIMADADDFEQLENSSIGSVVETPIAEYPEVGVMIDFINEHQDEEPVKFYASKLAKKGRGRVKRDKMEDYLSSKHLPSSGLKEVLKNPANFFFYLNDRKRIFEPEKPHFQLGTFIHMALHEPKLFSKVKTEPKASKASTEGCLKLCEFYRKVNRDKSGIVFEGKKLAELKEYIEAAQASCKFMMVGEEHKVIIEIIKKNYKNYGKGIIPKIMKGALVETSFYGTDEKTGLKVKVRPDAVNFKENIGVNAIISIKTTAAESVEKFMSDCAKFNYELSEGMYQEVASNVTGRKFDSTIMIMAQTKAPYQMAVIWWSPEDLQNGKYKYRYALDTAKECIDSKLFPGYESLAEEGNSGIILAKQPQWAHKVLSPIDLED